MTANPFETIDSRLNAIEAVLSEIVHRLPSSETGYKNDLGDISVAIEETGLSKAHIYYLTCKERIPHIKKGGKLYFKRSDLRAWLQEGNKQIKAK
jgi:hypothetical protein